MFKDYQEKLAFAEQELRRQLGPSLWESLQIDSKEHFKNGFVAYHNELGMEHSEFFHPFGLHFSLGIQVECAYWIWNTLRQEENKLRQEFKGCRNIRACVESGCRTRDRCKNEVIWPGQHEIHLPSVAFYGHMLDRCRRGLFPDTQRLFKGYNQRFSDLCRFANDLLGLSSNARTPAAHDPHFSRPQSEGLFQQFFHDQFLRRFFLALQGKEE